MPSIIPGYEYDIFISYRQKDNVYDGWVTAFVSNLRKELEATFKEDVTIYFDENPHDGLLETHDVDDSLQEKLKCLIFIPILSQTYCDPESYAWKGELVPFVQFARNDRFGLKVRLRNGNVGARILPVRIHDLDPDDVQLFEKESGGPIRSIDFIFKSPGVNRPLTSSDDPMKNIDQTYYRDQINKVANAIKDRVSALKDGKTVEDDFDQEISTGRSRHRVGSLTIILMVILLGLLLTYFMRPTLFAGKGEEDPFGETLERAEKYLKDAARFEDDRYFLSAISAASKVVEADSTHEKALSVLARAFCELGMYDSTLFFIDQIFALNTNSKYGYQARAVLNASSYRRNFLRAIADFEVYLASEPTDEDAIAALSSLYLDAGDFVSSWKYAQKYEQVTGDVISETLSALFLELGDFKEAIEFSELRRKTDEFSCWNIEEYQKIYLCSGDYEKLEALTDSLCRTMECKSCPYWQMRIKMHLGKFDEAYKHVSGSTAISGGLAWRVPAYVLYKVGKVDSATMLMDMELKAAERHINDTSYHLSLPYYSMSAINAFRGNYDESIRWLRQYADKGFVWGSEWYIIRDPFFDGLKSDSRYFPEFMQIVQKAQTYKTTQREKIRELQSGGD